MSEQRFPGRIWITNPDTDFLRMQNLGPQHEWLHLTEHKHLMAENERRIERLREALKKLTEEMQVFLNVSSKHHFPDAREAQANALAALQEDK